MSSQRRLDRIFVQTDPYTTTNDFLRVPGAMIDLRQDPTSSLAIRVSNTGGSNDINYKVRGSVDGTNFTDVITLVLAGTEQAATGATVQENSSAEVFITDAYDGGAPASFNFYDVVAESTSDNNHSTVVVVISAR
jgi:hypothetical protein